MRVPNHGGTPSEMLRDVADYMDLIDGFAKSVHLPEEEQTLYEMLNPSEEDTGTVQADLLWLAEQLEEE